MIIIFRHFRLISHRGCPAVSMVKEGVLLSRARHHKLVHESCLHESRGLKVRMLPIVLWFAMPQGWLGLSEWRAVQVAGLS